MSGVVIVKKNNGGGSGETSITWREQFLGYYADEQSFNDLFEMYNDLTVAEAENVMLSAISLKTNVVAGVTRGYFERYKWAKGSGVFAPIGAVEIGTDILFESSNIVASYDDINLGNTVIRNLGIIFLDANFVDLINFSLDGIDFSDPEKNYLVQFNQNGIAYLYSFKGIASQFGFGVYGIGQKQATMNDFDAFADSIDIPTTDGISLEQIQDMIDEANLLKQDKLVSGTSIKTFNNINLLGSGNIGIPVLPPPYLEELIPDSYLPSTTGNFILRGSFFTQNMTVVANGQTLNYIVFVSDNEVRCNITTSANEGTYDVTLNNGTSMTKLGVLLVTLGTVVKPQQADWQNISSLDVSEEASARIIGANIAGTAEVKSSFFKTPIDDDYSVLFRVEKSPTNPYFVYDWDTVQRVDLLDVDTNTIQYSIVFDNFRTSDGYHYFTCRDKLGNTGVIVNGFNLSDFGKDLIFRKRNGVFGFYNNGALRYSPPYQNNVEMYMKVSIKGIDVTNIKLVR